MSAISKQREKDVPQRAFDKTGNAGEKTSISLYSMCVAPGQLCSNLC